MIAKKNTERKEGRRRMALPRMMFVFAFLSALQFSAKTETASVDFRAVDLETYRLFMEQKWDSVIIVGKTAIRNNVDYFYLRLRMGISYYQLKKYILAIEHLEKARDFNSNDPVALEYLYAAYLESGRNSNARALAMNMPEPLKSKLQAGTKTMDQVHLEGGYTFSNNDKGLKKSNLMGQDSIYGEEDRYGDHYYLSFDLSLNLSSRVSLALAYNFLSFSKQKYFQWGYYQDHLDSTTNFYWGYLNHYSWDRQSRTYLENYTINQHEAYIGSTFQLNGGFRLMPSVHLIYASSGEPIATYDGRMIYDTIFVDTITPDTGVYMFPRADYSFNQKTKRSISYLFSLMLTKDFSVFSSGLAASYSNLNKMDQAQLSWSLTYYPWGRTGIYGTSSFIALFQEGETNLVFSQVIGGMILPGLWLGGSAIIGDLTNANLMNGFIVYNNTDKINYRLGADLKWSLTDHLDISLIYQFFSNKNIHYYYTWNPGDQYHPVKLVTDYNNYQTNTIIGGITWKF